MIDIYIQNQEYRYKQKVKCATLQYLWTKEDSPVVKFTKTEVYAYRHMAYEEVSKLLCKTDVDDQQPILQSPIDVSRIRWA